MPAAPTTVHLGDLDYVLVPQRHTSIKRGVARIFESLGEDDIGTGDGLVGVLATKAHAALKVFIPSLMSYEDFNGDGPDGDEHVPTIPEIRDAIRAGLEVNGMVGFSGLRDLLPMDLVKAQIGVVLAEAVAQSARQNSLSLPSASGASGSTPSTPSSRTSTPKAPSGSRSRVSRASSKSATGDDTGS